MDVLGMTIRVGCKEDGTGGTVVDLPSSMLKLPEGCLETLTAACVEKAGGLETEVENPDFKPNAKPGLRGERTISVTRTPQECVALYYKGVTKSLIEEYVKRQARANIEVTAQQQAEQATAGIEGL